MDEARKLAGRELNNLARSALAKGGALPRYNLVTIKRYNYSYLDNTSITWRVLLTHSYDKSAAFVAMV